MGSVIRLMFKNVKDNKRWIFSGFIRLFEIEGKFYIDLMNINVKEENVQFPWKECEINFELIIGYWKN